MNESVHSEGNDASRLLDAFCGAGEQPAVYRRSPTGEAMLAIGVSDDDATDDRRRIFWRAFDQASCDTDSRWSAFGRTESFTPRLMAIRRPGGRRIDVVGDEMATFDQYLDRHPRSPTEPPVITDRTELDETSFVDGVRRIADEGAVPKAVIARRLAVTTATPMDPGAIARHLVDTYPSCTVFAISPRDALWPVFVGATPERLVEIDDGIATTMALAGTTRDIEGRSLEVAEEALLTSQKDRREHRFVRDMIVDVLEPYCRCVEADDEPGILRLGRLSHLHTPIRGELADTWSLVDVADALHPTPAVCGTPRDQALFLVRDVEPFDRGLYAGVLGWTDGAGNGEADVLLRAGLIDGRRAELYAGAGITADSDIDVEWRETSQKFRPLLDAITGGHK